MKRMRPTKATLLVGSLLVLSLLLFGCSPTEPVMDTAAEQTETSPEKEKPMEQILVWLSNGFDKITDDMTPAADASQTVDIWMAKNETEGAQVSLRAPKRYGSVTFSCTSQTKEGAPTMTIYRETTIPTGGKYYPDPLAPFSGKLTLLADTTTTLYLSFAADKDTAAGAHSYTFALDGQDVCTVNVHVWDFALPDTLSCATAMGLYKESIAKMHPGVEGEALDALYVAYYDTLLSYKVSAYDLPYDILDSRADAYMSNPLVTAFKVPTCHDDDPRLTRIYEKLCSNPVWLAKAYFYPLDEPTSKAHLEDLAALCERLKRIAPEIKVCTPFFRNIDYDKDTDQITFMTGRTTLWCPKSYMYVTSNIYSEAQMVKYAPFGERMAERKAAGDKVWWYVCWEPGDPYNNLFIDQKGVQHRILFWQQYDHGVDGFLYWGANYWLGTADPWNDMATVKDLSSDVYGDGSLLYNGSQVGLANACGSLRLAAVRDGIEDFELLKLAEELLGKDWVDEMVDKVTPSLTRYSTDSDNFTAVRKAIGDAVEEKLS